MASPPQKSRRNWADLPPDITLTILTKLGATETLESAQFVCRTWYDLCMDPSMWTSIVMDDIDYYEKRYSKSKTKFKEMAMNAVDRSLGGLVIVSIAYFATDDLLMYIADRSRGLRCLKLTCCDLVCQISKAVKKLPQLDELELTLCSVVEEEIKAVGHNCPSLRTFRLNHQGYPDACYADDQEAFFIAKTMPQLRHLQITGNGLTNAGLNAILNGCPLLESLDLSSCFHIDLSGDLGKRCSERIKYLRCPLETSYEHSFATWLNADNDIDDFKGFGAFDIPLEDLILINSMV